MLASGARSARAALVHASMLSEDLMMDADVAAADDDDDDDDAVVSQRSRLQQLVNDVRVTRHLFQCFLAPYWMVVALHSYYCRFVLVGLSRHCAYNYRAWRSISQQRQPHALFLAYVLAVRNEYEPDPADIRILVEIDCLLLLLLLLLLSLLDQMKYCY